MAGSKAEVIAAIDAFMQKYPYYPNSDWYVGIASDPRKRLFEDHNVNEESGIWICERARSAAVAREVEHAYLGTGHDGGGGGGDESSIYVYAYVKLQGTIR